MVFPALVEAEGKLALKQDELGKIFAEAGAELDLSKVKSISGSTAEKAEAIRALNAECTALAKEHEELKAVAQAAEASKSWSERGNAGAGTEEGDGAKGHQAKGGGVSTKSFGEMFTESDAFKTKGAESHLDFDLKTLMSTTAGFAPETTRSGRIVDFATRPLQVLDLIPTTTTDQAAVTYMEETTFTNNAAEVAEAGTYPEAALALTEQTSPVRKIGVWLPVTDEQLEDVPRMRGYIDNRLPFMVRQRLDSQILVGNGTAPNLRGVLNIVGIQTQAKGADPVPDAVYKAMTKVRVTGRAMPDAFVAHPNDWQDVRLLRTADGIYIWGNPADAGPERIWGLRVAIADGLTENTGVVGDFGNFSELAMRRGMDIQTTNAHADFFINGKQAIRADIRAALVFYRPAAFCTVTGI